MRHCRWRVLCSGESPWSHGPSALGHLPKQSHRPGPVRFSGPAPTPRHGSYLLHPKLIPLLGHLASFYFYFLTLKESPIGEAGSEGGGSQAGMWASEGFIPGLSY